MSAILSSGLKWGKRAIAIKLGKFIIKRGGPVGIGIGAIAGAGYLAYNFINENKKNKRNLKPVEDISDNEHHISGKSKIVI